MKVKDLLNLKTMEELRDEAIQELKDRDFKIKNFRAGRVFYTLLELSMIAVSSLFSLLSKVMGDVFLEDATGQWLDIVALDRAGVIRKQPQKTQGNITASRADTSIKGTLFEGDVVTTEEDADGNVLRFLVTETTVLDVGIASAAVPVEAELGGSEYNVSAGQITQLATFRVGIDDITNDADWIVQEGTDEEDDESLRRRAQTKLFAIAYGGNKAMYQSLAEEVTGVARARVDTNLPRGEGTIDVVLIGIEGIPTQGVIDQVQEKLDEEGSAIADILVKAITELAVDVEVTLHYDPRYGDPAVIEPEAQSIINDMFKVTPVDDVKQFNIEYGVDRSLIYSNLRDIENVVSVEVTTPADDIQTGAEQLAVPGIITINTVQAVM